jgi:hypothetical protein
MNRLEQEIPQLEKSFQAVLMAEIGSHRQKVGANVVGIYLEAIKRHHSRYQEKSGTYAISNLDTRTHVFWT